MGEGRARWRILHDTFVAYADGGPLTAEQFEIWYQALHTEKFSRYLGAAGENFQSTAEQRVRLAGVLKGRQLKFAVITDSRVVQAMVTAMNWLGANMAAFSWQHIPDGGKWLNLTDAQSQEVANVIHLLRERTGFGPI